MPGTSGRFRCGGLLVELQTARLVGQLRPSDVVTYRQREPGHPFLADLLRREPAPGQALWVVSWGFDVPQLLQRLRNRPVAYHAHSSGYGFDLPAGVPVLAVSRNTLGYWGARAPRNPLFLVPNALDPKWLRPGSAAVPWRDPRGASPPAAVGGAMGGVPRAVDSIIPRDADASQAVRRPIDVLVQVRKTSRYVLERLVPALRDRGLRVELQEGWVDDLVDLFRSATVVLYDSADYWRGRGVSEGFGLPPLEALASGCVVFSSLNHALADSLDPGVVGHQIGCGSLGADLARISAAVADPEAWRAEPEPLAALLRACSEPELAERWRLALAAIDSHWQRLLLEGEPALVAASPFWLRLEPWRQRLARVAGGRLRRWPLGR